MLTHKTKKKVLKMAKTITSALPPGTDQLGTVKAVTQAMQDHIYAVEDAQTANNRVGPGSDKSK
jgi:hypothetical protein